MHCKIIRTGIHKGNPLVPFVESGYAVLLKTLFAKSSARTGRFGNPIGRVSDGSFPYFCPYRNRVPARHERKKTLFFKKGKTDCRAPDGGLACRSVGASAPQRCPPDTRTAMTKETDLGALKRAAENGSPDL